MDDYLAKPVRPEQLQAALTRWAPAAGEACAPVDAAILQGFRQLQEEGAPDVVTEFIDLFLDDLPSRREAILEALARADAEGIRARAHALKGSAAYIGAGVLAELCRELETAARQGDLAGAARLGAAIEEEATRVGAYLATQRSSPGR
jgi:HPt (histidine-containing phosphotransfer) domain-containing protein